jgi:hypothetical protein
MKPNDRITTDVRRKTDIARIIFNVYIVTVDSGTGKSPGNRGVPED